MHDFFYTLNFYDSNDFGEHRHEQINKLNGRGIVTPKKEPISKVIVHG